MKVSGALNPVHNFFLFVMNEYRGNSVANVFKAIFGSLLIMGKCVVMY